MRDCRKDRKPPYAERHVRWCERSHGELIPMLLLDRQSSPIGNGIPYKDIVEQARLYIHTIGGFEKFAEWGLIRPKE